MEELIGSTALSLSILPGNHALNRFVLSFIFFFFDILSKQKPVYIRTHPLWTGTLNSEHNQALSSVELTFSDFFLKSDEILVIIKSGLLIKSLQTPRGVGALSLSLERTVLQ